MSVDYDYTLALEIELGFRDDLPQTPDAIKARLSELDKEFDGPLPAGARAEWNFLVARLDEHFAAPRYENWRRGQS